MGHSILGALAFVIIIRCVECCAIVRPSFAVFVRGNMAARGNGHGNVAVASATHARACISRGERGVNIHVHTKFRPNSKHCLCSGSWPCQAAGMEQKQPYDHMQPGGLIRKLRTLYTRRLGGFGSAM
jgi:hypothetical protein